MKHEKVIQRVNGDTILIVTLISSNLFLDGEYELEQFAMLRKKDSLDWCYYYHRRFPKNISREEYMRDHRPKTFFGIVTIGEALKAGMEAHDIFFAVCN